jgi:hypothetical protein
VLSHPRLGNRPDGISIRHKLVLEDHLGAVVVEGANLKPAHLEWKSQRMKIHRLDYRFSIDFFNPFPKSQTFGKSLETFGSRIYFLRFFKSIGWYRFLAVLNLCHQNLSKKLSKKRAASKVWTKVIKVNKPPPPPPPHRNP